MSGIFLYGTKHLVPNDNHVENSTKNNTQKNQYPSHNGER